MQSTFRGIGAGLVTALAVLALPAFGDAVIRFEPGPLNGYHIYTPWGDFIGVQDGNVLWVGTPEEYEHRKVVAISAEEGFREEPGRPNHFIPIGLPSTAVGATAVSAISTSLLSSPAKHSESIDVVWLQSGPEHISFTYIDTVTGKTAKNTSCGRVQDFNYCDFRLSDEAMVQPGLAVFTVTGKQPGIVKLDSPARSLYTSLKVALNPEHSSLPALDPSPEQQKQLDLLHALDSSIPASVASR